MGFSALRSIVRPLTRALLLPHSTSPPTAIIMPAANKSELVRFSWLPISNRLYNSLTDTRLPKRRPSNTSRPKRASLRPPGPYKMVDYVPGEPIVAKPNEGSVKRRNEKKRIRMRRAFILEEKLKRKAERQAADRRKREQKVERKMAKVARQRAWVVRLAELKRLEEEKKSNAIA